MNVPRTSCAIVIASAVTVCYVALSRTLLMPWFWFTEEAPYAQEAFRFLSVSFRQEFFDIPGTPFIMLTACVLRVVLGVLSIFTGHPESAFDHLDLLYSVMRFISALSFVAAGLFMYLTARQLASALGAML